jgi:hypothetical protein
MNQVSGIRDQVSEEVTGASRRKERTGLQRACGPRNDGPGRLGVLLIPVLCLLIPACASTDYNAYLKAQQAAFEAQKPVFELEAMPGEAITGLKAIRVYAQAPAVQQARPSEWAGVLGTGLQVLGIVGGIKYQGEAAANLATAVGGAANHGYRFIQAPQANQSVGTGFIGRGLYSDGNSGVIGGGANSDSTHAPVVVSQPAPVVVEQPRPVVVEQPPPIVVPAQVATP